MSVDTRGTHEHTHPMRVHTDSWAQEKISEEEVVVSQEAVVVLTATPVMLTHGRATLHCFARR